MKRTRDDTIVLDDIPVNPFGLLVPDNWTLVRQHLVNTHDARDLVCLQRTCKAGYALHTDLILGPAWQALYDEVAKKPFMTRIQQWGFILTVLQEVTKQRLWDKPWFKPPVLTLQPNNGYYYIQMAWSLDATLGFALQCAPASTGWSLQLVTGAICKYVITANTLAGIMEKSPMLCFGIDPEIIRRRQRDDDLFALFVVKQYRR